jgi:4-amino-4-deoxychorismate lyase
MTTQIFRGDQMLDSLAGDDRGLAYGHGLFETILVHHGQPVWWREHWQRLEQGARVLGIPMPEESVLRGRVDPLIASATRAVLKIIVTGGRGGRGYASPAEPVPTVIVSLHDSPPPVSPEGIAVRWCQTALAIQPALAGIKHCNRLEQVLARAEWSDPEIFEGLVCDTDGRVISATAANLFARIGGRWLTPGVQRCGVAGIARGWLMAHVDRAGQADLTRAEIENAEAVFLCNAVRGILPVRQLGQRQWLPDAGVEQIRRQLAQALPAFSFQEH